MDDCVAVVDDRENLVSLSEETTTEEEVKPRSAAAADDDDEVEEKLKQNGSSGGGTGGGRGIIDKILSHFHEPAAPLPLLEEELAAAGDQTVDGGEQSISTSAVQKQEIDGGGGGGGIIDKIRSHLHGFGETPAAAADQEEFEQAQLQEVVGSNHREQVTESNGGGLLNQIITNLPTVSIPDHDTSPKAEEASLLIHIVQD